MVDEVDSLVVELGYLTFRKDSGHEIGLNLLCVKTFSDLVLQGLVETYIN